MSDTKRINCGWDFDKWGDPVDYARGMVERGLSPHEVMQALNCEGTLATREDLYVWLDAPLAPETPAEFEAIEAVRNQRFCKAAAMQLGTTARKVRQAVNRSHSRAIRRAKCNR